MPRTRDPEKLIAMRQRKDRIIELRRDHTPWKDIADIVGLSMSHCCELFQAYIQDIPAEARNAYLAKELEDLDWGQANLRKKVDNPKTGDHGFVEAIKEHRMHGESRRKLLGLDPPLRREIEVVDTASEEARMERELAETTAMVRAAQILNQGDHS